MAAYICFRNANFMVLKGNDKNTNNTNATTSTSGNIQNQLEYTDQYNIR